MYDLIFQAKLQNPRLAAALPAGNQVLVGPDPEAGSGLFQEGEVRFHPSAVRPLRLPSRVRSRGGQEGLARLRGLRRRPAQARQIDERRGDGAPARDS